MLLQIFIENSCKEGFWNAWMYVLQGFVGLQNTIASYRPIDVANLLSTKVCKRVLKERTVKPFQTYI